MNAVLFTPGTRKPTLAQALGFAVTLCLLAAAIGAAVAGVGLAHHCLF